MNEMYNRIAELCKEKGVNMTQMCRDANIPRGNLTDLKKGRTAALSTKTLSKISEYFGVSMEYLLGNTGMNNVLYQIAKDNGLEKAAQLLKYGEIKQPTETDGLSDNKLALIELVKMLPEDKAAMSLRVLRSILADD